MNAAFADAVIEELDLRPGAAVYLHDYHLYVAPRLVRRQRPHALLAHFVHIPWVGPPTGASCLRPSLEPMHDGLLANDVVSFHTERWRAAFLASCARARPARGRNARDGAPDLGRRGRVRGARAERGGTRARARARREPSRAADRARRPDGSVQERGRGGSRRSGCLLDRRPDLRGRVRMLALLDPSRQSIPEYVE